MAARFKLDENIPRDAVALLQSLGHDVQTALQEGLGGRPDLEVLDRIQGEGRILVTLDLDFSDIRIFPPNSHSGIWVLRPGIQAVENILALLRGAVELLASESAHNRLWVLEPGRVRIRER